MTKREEFAKIVPITPIAEGEVVDDANKALEVRRARLRIGEKGTKTAELVGSSEGKPTTSKTKTVAIEEKQESQQPNGKYSKEQTKSMDQHKIDGALKSAYGRSKKVSAGRVG